MTADELKSHIVRGLTGLLGYAAGRYHFSVETIGAITSDIGYVGSVGAFLYGGYLHWGMKKVPDTAIVAGNTAKPNTTGLAALLALGLGGALAFSGGGSARAADLIKAQARAPAAYDPIGTGGFYVGLGSQLATAKATIGTTDVLSQSGSIGAIAGYGRGNGVTWWQVQAEAYYQNLSGDGFCGLSAPCGVGSKFAGAAVFKFGGPITGAFLQSLPQVSSLFPGLSPTAIANNVFPYIGGVINFEDVSGTFGDANARDWRFPVGLRLGAITKLTNGSVSDAGVEVDFAGSGFAVGKAMVNPGTAYKAYLHFAFGA